MSDRAKVIKGLQIERECVSRDCDRDCGKCDLVQDRDWLLSVYDGAIALLKEQEAVEPIKKDTVEITARYEFDCPCGAPLLIGQPYCADCGRSVKWK